MSVGEDIDPDDPIEEYLEHRERIRDQQTVRNDRDYLKRFKDFIDKEGVTPREVTPDICEVYFQRLMEEENLSRRSATEHIAKVDQFYQYYNVRGYYEANPMEIAREGLKTTRRRSKQIREMSIEQMRNFVKQITHPLTLVVVVLLVKTGVREGEAYNIDLRDLHIEDQRVKNILPSPRSEIKNKPDSLYIPHDISKGDVYNGEKRLKGNKRDRSTTIPIDDELKDAMIYWLAVRPPANSPAKPLFTSVEAQGEGQIYGDRISSRGVYRRVITKAESEGLWESPGKRGDQSTPNVRPHYFRHFFTTHCRERMDDRVVEFIRGDVGDKTMDDYTHNWGNKVEREYRENIYKILE